MKGGAGDPREGQPSLVTMALLAPVKFSAERLRGFERLPAERFLASELEDAQFPSRFFDCSRTDRKRHRSARSLCSGLLRRKKNRHLTTKACGRGTVGVLEGSDEGRVRIGARKTRDMAGLESRAHHEDAEMFAEAASGPLGSASGPVAYCQGVNQSGGRSRRRRGRVGRKMLGYRLPRMESQSVAPFVEVEDPELHVQYLCCPQGMAFV